ncbi:hypothetical protein KIL84_000705 [Mauremys mutica]|uniref:Uncharacterized protein n=1 Tax=Mauremys mutica TaxID=74926 RepID=A0A9D3WZ97_9SAUR|nr:hypothetical protein KIL84_000596 [Mauremys mutica]KAH1169720.1 hypothetical protein KIL84_000705 [Mauremys mutica]
MVYLLYKMFLSRTLGACQYQINFKKIELVISLPKMFSPKELGTFTSQLLFSSNPYSSSSSWGNRISLFLCCLGQWTLALRDQRLKACSRVECSSLSRACDQLLPV